MIVSTTHTNPHRSSVGPSQEGPVLLATKPFSELGAPLAVAHWLAGREDRELRIVTVVESDAPAITATGVPAPTDRSLDEQCERAETCIRQQFCGSGTTRRTPQIDVRRGSSLAPIMETAREHHARVVVVGSGRHNPLGRYIYGERALQILGIADRPVLVVPRGGIELAVSVAVVATDFSPASVRAARAVLPMLSQGGRLIVVHAKTAVALDEAAVGWWNEAYERRCADLFGKFLRQLPDMPTVTVETAILHGDAAKAIVDFAGTRGAGLIACGRLGHSLAERILVGSVSSALVRQATCPVLVAPELPGDAEIAQTFM